MKRILLLFVVMAAPAFPWVESVQFPWNKFPKQLWERELVWMKNIGVRHVSLPAPGQASDLNDVLQILRRIGMEADIEGTFPEELKPYTRAHGGPLVDVLPQPANRVSALTPNALIESRKLLEHGTASLIWTDVESTLWRGGFRAGAVSFTGEESPATMPIRRNARLLHLWAETFGSLRPVAGVAAKPATVDIDQFISEAGISAVNVGNRAKKDFQGEIRILLPPARHLLSIPKLVVPAGNTVLLPVNIPLGGNSLCKACTAFAASDHLIYATSELTALEYENGILAMEFSAPAPGEVILQLSREPSGPYVAGGKPTEFDWDTHTQRARLAIPRGAGVDNRVRVGLAIEPPDATAFFDSARVLVIGEKNDLTAQFSSPQIARRSRLIAPPGFLVSDDVRSPLEVIYHITVPESVVHGDHAELAIEGDGAQFSHSRPQLLRPASLRFAEAVAVALGTDDFLPMFPTTIPINARSGREITIAVRNNAPEIRNFELHLSAEGLNFSPASMKFSVGASTSRDMNVRVFPTGTPPGLHDGAAVLSGAAYFKEPLRFLVLPSTGDISWTSGDFTFLESTKVRATLLGDQWIELVDKDKNENRLASPMELPSGEKPSLSRLEMKLPKSKAVPAKAAK